MQTSMPSATRSSAAARWPGSGTCSRWRPAFSASTANTTSCARPSPTAATFRACRRCALGGGTYWRNDNWFVRMGLLHAFGQSDLGRERHADRRLQPAQGGDQQQAVLEKFAVGSRPRSRPASSATICSTSTSATPCNSTRTRSCCRGAASSSSSTPSSAACRRSTRRGYSKAPTGFGAPVFKAPIRSAWSWAGLYVGGTIGYGWGKSNTDTVFSDPAIGGPLFATSGSRKLDGAIGGAQAGYNWVAGNVLAGVEADLNYSGQRATLRAGCPGDVCNPALVGFRRPVGDWRSPTKARSWNGSRRCAGGSAPPLRLMLSPMSPAGSRSARS